jgi:Flp pilus assembly protein TadG
VKPGYHRQRGQVIVWVAVMLPFFLAVIGLASDGGLVFEQRRALQALADEAARAGANQLDQAAYRADGVTVLDPAAARQAAEAYLVAQSPALTGTVVADRQRVIVRVQRQVPTNFLRIVHITTATIGATATAEVRHGITRGTS